MSFFCPTECIFLQTLFLVVLSVNLFCFLLQEIPPFETKGVMRASFSSRDVDNHTAFIRIKTNAANEDRFIILPVEVEVTSGQSLHDALITKRGECNSLLSCL